MHAFRRSEKRGGYDHIKEVKLVKASLMWPLEQRFLNSAVNDFVLKEWEVELWRGRRVVEVRRLMHLCWFMGLSNA